MSSASAHPMVTSWTWANSFRASLSLPHLARDFLEKRRLAFDVVLRLVRGMPGTEKNESSIKKEAAKLVRKLPDSASWDDLMYDILVRQKIEAGLGDLQNERKHTHAAIRKEFGVT